jgi:hypothetical protein
MVTNITEGQKRDIPEVPLTALEPDLLYPLLRGRDVKRWQAQPSAWILMVQDPEKRQGIDEKEIQLNYPKTWSYLKQFEVALGQRKSRGVTDMVEQGAPFYTMFAISDYTFAPHKVVWRYIATEFTCAVVSDYEDEYLGKRLVVPDHRLMTVRVTTSEEAHYLCGVLNSAPSRFLVQSYVVETQISTHALQNMRVPEFDPKNPLHLKLAQCSEQAHSFAAIGEDKALSAVEDEIDRLAGQLWGLSEDELAEIKKSLDEIS